jgi:hypothetical protein
MLHRALDPVEERTYPSQERTCTPEESTCTADRRCREGMWSRVVNEKPRSSVEGV